MTSRLLKPRRKPTSQRRRKRSPADAPTAVLLVFFLCASLVACFFGDVVHQTWPQWRDAINKTHSLTDFGWNGALATTLMALVGAAAALWTLLAAVAADALKQRFL